MSQAIKNSINEISDIFSIIESANKSLLMYSSDINSSVSIDDFLVMIESLISDTTIKINDSSVSDNLKISTINAFTDACNQSVQNAYDHVDNLNTQLAISSNYFASDDAIVQSENLNPELNYLIAVNNNDLTLHEKKSMLRIAAEQHHPEALFELNSISSPSTSTPLYDDCLSTQNALIDDFKSTIQALSQSDINNVFTGIIDWSDDLLKKKDDFIARRIVAYAYETTITSFSPEIKGFSSILHRLHLIYSEGIGVPINVFKANTVQDLKNIFFELEHAKYVDDGLMSYRAIIVRIESIVPALSLNKYI